MSRYTFLQSPDLQLSVECRMLPVPSDFASNRLEFRPASSEFDSGTCLCQLCRMLHLELQVSGQVKAGTSVLKPLHETRVCPEACLHGKLELNIILWRRLRLQHKSNEQKQQPESATGAR